nr:fatty acid synthase-like [Vanessa tameamea]
MSCCSRAMIANRISHWLGVTGPSYAVDSACSSSMYALEHAYKAIRDGHCDAAIVGGSHLCLHPYVSFQFSRLGVLSPDGRCKCFDNDANGYVRSEAIVVCLLQKAKDSRRVYAQVIHAKTNCDGFKNQGITYPSGDVQKLLLCEFYEECSIPPNTFEYVEAHGTAAEMAKNTFLWQISNFWIKFDRDQVQDGGVKYYESTNFRKDLYVKLPSSFIASYVFSIRTLQIGSMVRSFSYKITSVEGAKSPGIKYWASLEFWKLDVCVTPVPEKARKAMGPVPELFRRVSLATPSVYESEEIENIPVLIPTTIDPA